ncbi:MAG: nuclear transport factor 2 family protein [Bdellovibrionota bacterium]
MRTAVLIALVFLTSVLNGAPSDPRLELPTALNFVRYCSSMFGEAPFAVSLEDTRLAPLLDYYRNVDAGDLEAILVLFSNEPVYTRNGEQFVGTKAVRDFFIERLQRLRGEHRLLGASIKGNQYFFHGTFEGTQFGEPIHVDFFDYWVLDSEGKVFYRQSWTSKPV